MSDSPPDDAGRAAQVREMLGEVRARVADVVDVAERDPAEHTALRARLDEVPADKRGRPWREASVLTDLAFRERPVRTRRQLRKMRTRDAQRGKPELFDRFWEECVAAMAPYTLGPHGYRRALGTTDPAAVWREVLAIVERLDDLGHPCWVNSGTLLGLVRGGGLIGHDDDVDLAVLLEAGDDAAAAEEWPELRRRLGEAGLLDTAFEELGKDHCRVAVHGGLEVDLFPAWVVDGRVRVWPHTYDEAAFDDLLPLGQRLLGGRSIPLPRHPEPFLVANYGADWTVPDPTFRFDWAAAKARFADFLGPLRGTIDEEGDEEGDEEPDEEDVEP